MSEKKGYILNIQSPYGGEKIEVSAAQVQFWPEILDGWTDNYGYDYIRVDLMTNEWKSKVITRLDK